jgi:hypothetical protein
MHIKEHSYFQQSCYCLHSFLHSPRFGIQHYIIIIPYLCTIFIIGNRGWAAAWIGIAAYLSFYPIMLVVPTAIFIAKVSFASTGSSIDELPAGRKFELQVEQMYCVHDPYCCVYIWIPCFTLVHVLYDRGLMAVSAFHLWIHVGH